MLGWLNGLLFAEGVEFFSFGTNDLKQATYPFSREAKLAAAHAKLPEKKHSAD